MEQEQRCRPDQHTELREPARRYEQRGEAKHESIDGSEIGRPTPGTIADQQLVLEHERLGGDGADAAGAKQLREGDHQVDGEDEEFAHAANRTMFVRARKTVARRRIASQYEFATHRFWTAAAAPPHPAD